MKPISTILFILFACVSFSFAQQKNIHQGNQRDLNAPLTIEREMTLPELKESLEGTYRIEFSKPNYSILYSRDFLESIQAARREDEDVTIQWDQFTTITVYAFQDLETTTE